MNVINKFLDVMHLNTEDDDYDFDNEDYELEEEELEEKEPIFSKIKFSWKDKEEALDVKKTSSNNTITENEAKKVANTVANTNIKNTTNTANTVSDTNSTNTVANTNIKNTTNTANTANTVSDTNTTRRVAPTTSDNNSSSKTTASSTPIKATEQYRNNRVDRQKITPIKTRKQANGMEVCVIKPTSMEDEIEIIDTLLNGRTVIINMEGLDVELAQRIIDFTSGSTYAIHGNLQKISSYIFLATPNGIDISGDIQNLMESFNLAGLTV